MAFINWVRLGDQLKKFWYSKIQDASEILLLGKKVRAMQMKMQRRMEENVKNYVQGMAPKIRACVIAFKSSMMEIYV